jgi:hypothetical protein
MTKTQQTRKINPDVVPFQVQHLIDRLLSKKESVEIRSNYRNTLDDIQVAISVALKQFDKEQVDSWKELKKGKR